MSNKPSVVVVKESGNSNLLVWLVLLILIVLLSPIWVPMALGLFVVLIATLGYAAASSSTTPEPPAPPAIVAVDEITEEDYSVSYAPEEKPGVEAGHLLSITLPESETEKPAEKPEVEATEVGETKWQRLIRLRDEKRKAES